VIEIRLLSANNMVLSSNGAKCGCADRIAEHCLGPLKDGDSGKHGTAHYHGHAPRRERLSCDRPCHYRNESPKYWKPDKIFSLISRLDRSI
jgi:hypothetical protein